MIEIRTVRRVCLFAFCAFLTSTAFAASKEAATAKPARLSSRLKWTGEGDRYCGDSNGPANEAPVSQTALKSEAFAVSQPAAPQNAQDQDRVASAFLNERLAVWQSRMKLEDWHISIVLTRRDDLKAGTLGGIRWDNPHKTAIMSVMDASDYRLPFPQMLNDMEFTLVHELVHLELASLPRSEASRSNEEHAVNRIAEALLSFDHAM